MVFCLSLVLFAACGPAAVDDMDTSADIDTTTRPADNVEPGDAEILPQADQTVDEELDIEVDPSIYDY